MNGYVYIIFAGGASGMLAKYGIAKLEGQTALGKETETGPSAEPQNALRPRATSPAMRFRKTREGGMSAELGIRPLPHTELSGNTHKHPFRVGISGIGNDDPKPRFFRKGKKLRMSFPVGKKENVSPETETQEPPYRRPRDLMDAKNLKTEHLSRQLRVKEEPVKPETPGEYDDEESRDEGYAYTEEKWVKRI